MKCYKCEHEWIPRLKNPKCCPSCNSRYWKNKGYTQCEICKKNFLRINLHHSDGNHDNNKKNNLIFICNDCHTAIHHGIGRARNRKGVQGGPSKRNNYGNWRGKSNKLKNIIKLIEYHQRKLLARIKQ